MKLALLGMGVFFVYWVGWPQSSLSPVVPHKRLGVQSSHIRPSSSAGDPDEIVSREPFSGRQVIPPLQVVVERENGPAREVAPFIVDLNDGTFAELTDLPGIGPILAERIVAHRMSHGAFRRIEDLALVPGIGEKRLEQLRPLVGVRTSTMAIGIGS